jgi:nucleoside-diphosphate-sugar epimerase
MLLESLRRIVDKAPMSLAIPQPPGDKDQISGNFVWNSSCPKKDYKIALVWSRSTPVLRREVRRPPRDLDANARSTLLLAEWALKKGIPKFLHANS